MIYGVLRVSEDGVFHGRPISIPSTHHDMPVQDQDGSMAIGDKLSQSSWSFSKARADQWLVACRLAMGLLAGVVCASCLCPARPFGSQLHLCTSIASWCAPASPTFATSRSAGLAPPALDRPIVGGRSGQESVWIHSHTAWNGNPAVAG